LLSVPTAVGSCDPLLWREAIIGPALSWHWPESLFAKDCSSLGQGQPGWLWSAISEARRSLSRVPGYGLLDRSVGWCRPRERHLPADLRYSV